MQIFRTFGIPMDHLLLKRFLAVLLLLNLLLPLGLGLVHALESHRESSCFPESESHIHKGRTDCSFSHVVTPNMLTFASAELDNYLPFWPEFHTDATCPDQLNWALESNGRRGPPAFMFLL